MQENWVNEFPSQGQEWTGIVFYKCACFIAICLGLRTFLATGNKQMLSKLYVYQSVFFIWGI